MSINTQLSELQSNLQSAKDSFATKLSSKGITTITQTSPLMDMINSIDSIQTGGCSVFDFGDIGFTGVEEPLKTYYDNAKPIYDSWDPSQTNLTAKYKDNASLICFPLVDTSNAINMSEMFSGCLNLEIVPLLNTINVTNMSNMFYGVSSSIASKLKSTPSFNTSNVINMSRMYMYSTNLISISTMDTSNVTDMSYMFYACPNLINVPSLNVGKVTTTFRMFMSCTNLTTIPTLNTSSATDMAYMFNSCTNLSKITELDFSSITNTISILTTSNTVLVYMLIKNIGKSSCTTYDLSRATNWGTGVAANKQSLIDSLITYSYNRAANSMPTATITLSATTKALLTAGELASITNKGFTIATA